MAHQDQLTSVAPSSSYATPAADSKELCLLSLDGGGVKGLSSLLVLKQIMSRIDPDNPPKPCDYFHMIGGTSTGGLIALMLGRMRMSVDDCIQAYEDLAKIIFTKKRQPVQFPKVHKSQGKYDHDAFENAVKQILVQHGFDKDELLYEPSAESDACKTFVCTTSQVTSDTVVFSSYRNSRRIDDLLKRVKIWEAARATSAASTFFEPMMIDGVNYVDGGTGANNPVPYLWTEAQDIWRLSGSELERHITCLACIGTGIPKLQEFGPAFKDIGKAVLAIATETEKTSEMFRRSHGSLFKTGAFRFNVIRGLEDIEMDEATKLGNIKEVTRRYIESEEVMELIQNCAVSLRDQSRIKNVRFQASLLEMIAPDVIALNNKQSHSSQSDLEWFTHTKNYDTWKMATHRTLWYRMDAHNSDEHCEAVAAAVAYHMSSRITVSTHGFANLGHELSKVLYFQCDRSQCQMDKHSTSLRAFDPGILRVDTIIRSLICQTLIMNSTEGVSIEHQLLQLCHNDRTELLGYLENRANPTLRTLFDLFSKILELCSVPEVLAIDNLHLIKGPSSNHFVKSLRNLVERQKLRTIISSLLGATFEEHLSDALCVHDDTEYDECIETLHFEEWNAGGTLVPEAAEGTNEWIWTHRKFENWQAEDSSVLWIEGKPGSGKSVLAKSVLRKLGAPLSRKPTGMVPNNGSHSQNNTIPAVLRSEFARGIPAHWFYNTNVREKGGLHVSPLRSILFQVLSRSKDLFKGVASSFRRKHCHTWNYSEYADIFHQLDLTNASIICVIDAMDEAENLVGGPISLQHKYRPKTIIKDFIQEILEATHAKFKFIVLSRPQEIIEDEYLELSAKRKVFKIDLEYSNSKDVDIIVERGVCSLQRLLHLNDTKKTPVIDSPTRSEEVRGLRRRREVSLRAESRATGRIERYLRKHAAGVILWVNVVLEELEQMASDPQRERKPSFIELEEHMKSLPLKLEDLYQRIIKRLTAQSTRASMAQARSIFELIIGSASLKLPLTIREMEEALAVPTNVAEAVASEHDPIIDNRDRNRIRHWSDYRRHLRRICGPLIDVVKNENDNLVWNTTGAREENNTIGPDDIVQFMHLTVKVFLEKHVTEQQLRMCQKQAEDATANLVERYLQIGFPSSKASYSYQSDKEWSNDWHDRMRCLAEYLEDRVLLKFACSISQTYLNGSDHVPDFEVMLESLVAISKYKSGGRMDWALAGSDLRLERPFHWWCIEKDSQRDLYSSSEVKSAILSELISYACSQGLVTATTNVLELANLDTSARAIANGALITAIESELRVEAFALAKERLLVDSHPHDVLAWPIGPKERNTKLDPVVRLAVVSRSSLVGELFDQRDAFFKSREVKLPNPSPGAFSLESLKVDEEEPIEPFDFQKMIYGENKIATTKPVRRDVHLLIPGARPTEVQSDIDTVPPSPSDLGLSNPASTLSSSVPALEDDRTSVTGELDNDFHDSALYTDPMEDFMRIDRRRERERIELRRGLVDMANTPWPRRRKPYDHDNLDIEEAIRCVLKKLDVKELEDEPYMTEDSMRASEYLREREYAYNKELDLTPQTSKYHYAQPSVADPDGLIFVGGLHGQEQHTRSQSPREVVSRRGR